MNRQRVRLHRDDVALRDCSSAVINESNRIAFGLEREDSDSNGQEVSISGIYALYELRPNDSCAKPACHNV